jgi:hypothetical protein
MAGYFKEAADIERDELIEEVNRLLDAIALHRREHNGGPYCWRDRKLYAAIGFTSPAPRIAHSCDANQPRPR